MIVKLIAQTSIDYHALESLGTGYELHRDRDGIRTAFDSDELAEFAGRGCYMSFGRPNPATATSEGYLGHIQEIGHESVLEHGSATFYIEASRSLLAELTRHRHLSFSVVSQRYVDRTRLGDIHIPPVIDTLPEIDQQEALEILRIADGDATQSYYRLLAIFDKNNLLRKQAREAARAVLPNMTNSPMVVSTNHRGWRYMLKNRWHTSADAEIREMAGEILSQLRDIAPNTYQDIPAEPY